MTAQTNLQFQKFFTQFSQYLDQNYSRPTDSVEIEAIRNSPKRIRRLESLARLIIKENTEENCAAVALVENQWYFTANNFERIKNNIDKIFKALSKVKTNKNNDVISTREARSYLVESDLV